MADMKLVLRMLEEQRRALLAQLDGIDRAIAALTPVVPAHAGLPGTPAAPPEEASGPVQPRQVKARRVLTDAHKQALSAGRRKARHTREVGSGIARELPADDFAPAIGARSDADSQTPRLVKRPHRK